jgi:hypothetical protein
MRFLGYIFGSQNVVLALCKTDDKKSSKEIAEQLTGCLDSYISEGCYLTIYSEYMELQSEKEA